MFEVFDSVIFAQDMPLSYILVDTNEGQFLLTTIFNELSHENAKQILTQNSTANECFYFSNVDYFAYGRFGVAQGGKIARYLAFNEEIDDDKDKVVWIGKAHRWEVDTHTFYTKQKIAHYDMDFGTDQICEMAEYYLPFLDDDLQINSLTVYTKHKIILDTLQNLTSPNPKVFSPIDIFEASKKLAQHGFGEVYIKIYKYKTHYTLSCNFLNAYYPTSNVYDSKVLHSKRVATYNNDQFTFDTFKRELKHMFHHVKYATYLDFEDAARGSWEVFDNQNYRESNLVLKIEGDGDLSIALDTGRFFKKTLNKKLPIMRRMISFGSKIDDTALKNLYTQLLKLKI